METDFSGEQSYSQAEPSDSSIGDTSISISSDDIQKGTTNNFGTSFADDAQATVDPSNVLSKASFNETMGITALNPFGKDNFFTRAFGIDPRSLDYSGMGIDLGGTADLAYDRYLNPLVENKDGTFSLRSGLSAGERTVLGDVVEVDKRMGPGEQAARTVFGLATPIGMFASALGTTEKGIAPNRMLPGGLNYDPALDPNSPQYAGPQGILGGALSGIESFLTAGGRPVSRFFEDGKEKPTAQDVLQTIRGTFDPSKKEFSVDRDYRDFVTDMPSATGRGSRGIVSTNVAPFDSTEQDEISRVMNEKVASTDASTDTSKPREKVVGTPINLAGMLGDQKFDLSNQAGRDEYFNFIRRLSPNTFS